VTRPAARVALRGAGGAVLAAALAATILLALSCSRPEAARRYLDVDYSNWRRTTATPLDYPIPGHEDHFRIIRANGLAFSGARKEAGGKTFWSFPEGTLIIKEVYPTPHPVPGERPAMLTAMVKAPDDPRSRGGWLWIVKQLPGGSETVFGDSFCVTCHANANERHPYGDRNPTEEFRDYVFFPPHP
jgi:hypothetical protein